MTQTVLVPDWDNNPELRAAAKEYRPGSDFKNTLRFRYPIIFDDELDSLVVEIRGRISNIPRALQDLPFAVFKVEQNDSPKTPAQDGPYKERDITARVETRMVGGVPQQMMWVAGPDLAAVNEWFDQLRAGRKSQYNRYFA
jgi:hypothetical protein